MQVAASMMKTHPHPVSTSDAWAECINACFDCTQACIACADACLGEEHLQNLTRCIRLDYDCADICQATGKMLTRQTEPEPRLLSAQLEVCRMVCEICGRECEKHQDQHEHCRVCAQACRECQQHCDTLIRQMH